MDRVPQKAATSAGAIASGFSPPRLVVLALIAGVATSGIVFWPWIDAQRRAVIVVAEASHTPLVSRWATWSRGCPIPRTRPPAAFRRRSSAPAAAAAGPRSSSCPERRPGTGERAGAALRARSPRAGYLVVIPELSGMVDGEVADAFVRDAVNAALDVAHRSDVRRVKVSLVGA
jgi:hypothetical protein